MLAVALVLAYTLTGGFGTHPTAKTEVLIPKGTFYSIPARQSNAADFQTSVGGVVTGAIWNTWGINVYLMTPQEDYDLAEKGIVAGYTWSSGRIANLTETNLSISIEPGAWDVVFFNADNPTLNPVWTNTTVIGFYTDISLTPT